jgi:DNA mismatch repair protein MutL
MDEIRLLSDSIANQIAAGEVVQRPASVVKELLENAIDAGASSIQLIIKDAGRTLVQVIDDGKGMSPTDARMSFERHATSKIKESADLFNIRTMGFRGEALASIAAVAQVELKTKRNEDELATQIKIEGSQIKDQSFVQNPTGTHLSVKNLFFNVPARRNFLKSNPVEMKHILEEFQRVALAHPGIKFSLFHNEHELYKLAAANLSKRIVETLDNSYKDQMAICEVNTDYLKIKGYIGKPQMAKKSKGDQYFFVNNRYIKSSYLHHAILRVYDGTIAEGSNPFYVLFLEIDPKHIDINIHPTKTEIKFDDEKTVYAILRSAASQALGVYQVSPSIDFEADINVNRLQSYFSPQVTNFGSAANTSQSKAGNSTWQPSSQIKANTENWEKLFDGFGKNTEEKQALIFESKVNSLSDEFNSRTDFTDNLAIQIHQNFILTQVKSGMMLIDQERALERIYYEKYLKQMNLAQGVSQQLLFPKTVSLSSVEYQISLEIIDLLRNVGFGIEDFGQNTYLINGVPVAFSNEDEENLLKSIIEQYAVNDNLAPKDKKERFSKTLAKRYATKMKKTLNHEEIKALMQQLFETSMPAISPVGLPVFKILGLREIAQLLV